MRYTTILHDARVSLGLSLNEYCIADCIHRFASNPDSKVPGWCYASKQYMAGELGLTKEWVIKTISRLEEKGLLEKSEDGRLLRMTKKWFVAVISDGEQNSPPSVNGVHHTGEQNSPRTDNKSIDRVDNTSHSENESQKSLFSEEGKTTHKESSATKKKKKEPDPCHAAGRAFWEKEFPLLGWDGVSGIKLNEMLRHIRSICDAGGVISTPDMVSTMFEQVVLYAKETGHWAYGKPISTFRQQFGSIIHEMKNGKQQQKSTDRITETIASWGKQDF